jgi:hypothetical protein
MATKLTYLYVKVYKHGNSGGFKIISGKFNVI